MTSKMGLSEFNYNDERFADIQLLRYCLNGFEKLTLKQKILVYYLSEATLAGRDITFDQFGKYNLSIRKMLEVVFIHFKGDRFSEEFKALEEYLKRVWFSNGIYHHYGCEKFVPDFNADYLKDVLTSVEKYGLPFSEGQNLEDFCNEIFPIIFDPEKLKKRVNKSDGEDLVITSACNFYEGVTQNEVERYYGKFKDIKDEEPPMYGLNSRLIKSENKISEQVWMYDGLYGKSIKLIVYWLEKAATVAENEQQKNEIDLLIKYYHTGDLHDFDKYSIQWVRSLDGQIDFINGFIEVYGDPLALKGSWEGIVEYKDLEATKRTQMISGNAQWFEDHSPIDPRFRKSCVKGVTANVVCAAMLGGDEYPSTAIGINLPNADWIRTRYGSKSVTIGNLTDAYNKGAHGNGFKEEFVIDDVTCRMIDKYGDLCDDLHTDLHECLGHGSGQMLSGVDQDTLKAYGNTIEEARADLFGLYYIADYKMFELGLVPDCEAYKSQYYSYMMNGLMTQLVRIKPGHDIEEAHMRNRALIANWCFEKGKYDKVIELVKRDGKTYLRINDYVKLRDLIATLLAEIQRIKSEGDFSAARVIVESYAVRVDNKLHIEILERYKHLNLAPYKGFINPVMTPVVDSENNIIDINVDYTESYQHQMLRYSKDYATLI